MNIQIDDVLQNLSERGQLEWEAAVLRAENAALQATLVANGLSTAENVEKTGTEKP